MFCADFIQPDDAYACVLCVPCVLKTFKELDSQSNEESETEVRQMAGNKLFLIIPSDRKWRRAAPRKYYQFLLDVDMNYRLGRGVVWLNGLFFQRSPHPPRRTYAIFGLSRPLDASFQASSAFVQRNVELFRITIFQWSTRCYFSVDVGRFWTTSTIFTRGSWSFFIQNHTTECVANWIPTAQCSQHMASQRQCSIVLGIACFVFGEYLYDGQ